MKKIDPDFLIIAALLVILVVALLFAASALPADAGGDLPRKIVTTAPIVGVNCVGPCCCGEITVIYMGHYYGNPAYCRWFRPLREGQLITTTLLLRY